MKAFLTKGKRKAVPPTVLFIIVVGLLAFQIAQAPNIEMKVAGAFLLALWVTAGVVALWIFIPQWDPWLAEKRRAFKGRKIVALTFDDGPSASWTPQVLDILKERDVRASFFVVGDHAAKHPDLVRRAHDEGHVVGGHTATHRILTFLNHAQRMEEIESSIDVIEKTIGCRPNFFRLPHGFKFPGLYRTLRGWNLIPIPWTKGLWDTDMPTRGELMRRFTKRFKPFEILLLHDGITGEDPGAHRQSMVDALPDIIDEYRNRGYAFMTIADMGEATCEAHRHAIASEQRERGNPLNSDAMTRRSPHRPSASSR